MDDGADPFGMAFELEEQFLRMPEVGDGRFGDVAPLAEVGAFQPVADDDIPAILGAQARDDVGADEAGAAGDHDHAAHQPASPRALSVIFAMVRVVE